MEADETAQDWADRVGKRVSTIFIAALIGLFVYGYLGPVVLRSPPHSAASAALW